MEIKHAKRPNLIYGLLGLFLIAVPFVIPNPEFDNRPAFKICYLVFLSLVSAYFFYKALNNKPLYLITPDEITDCKNNKTYKLGELGYYKKQTTRFKFTTLEYINFYDTHKTFVFNIQTNGTNYTTDQVIDVVKHKLATFN